eukprot:SAG31_NODE_1849_length_7088_cov_2.647446_9_plen_90_part_00
MPEEFIYSSGTRILHINTIRNYIIICVIIIGKLPARVCSQNSRPSDAPAPSMSGSSTNALFSCCACSIGSAAPKMDANLVELLCIHAMS